MSNLQRRFPDILPLDEIRVGPEAHTYDVIEYDDAPNAVKDQYVPEKAPVLDVEDVSGIVNGESYTFDQGVDYEVIDTDNDGRLETIDFSVGGESPDPNTEFEITYVARSVIGRYVDSFADEFDRLSDDIDEAIGSHYIETATNTGYIDNFEDEELIEYSVDDTGGSAVVQTTTAVDGNWALKLQSDAGISSPFGITSTDGLERYPKRGDTFVYYMRMSNDGDVGHFDFMYNDSGSGEFYSIRLDTESDQITLQKDNSGQKQDSVGVNFGPHIGTWLQVEVSVDPIGDIIATVFDENGLELGSVTIVDTEYTNGGIRWRTFNDSESAVVYADAADIVERNSSDLDHIGAIFGELGRRRGRTDEEYATFLRSIVQSFSGRGTVDGIKFAVASALDLDADQIVIEEDFVDNEYTVNILVPFPPHELATLTELGDLADPSGVEFGSITYNVAEERVHIDDAVSISTGQSISDEVSVSDTVVVNANVVSTADSMVVSDAVQVSPNKTTVADSVQSDDAVATQMQTVEWGTDWNTLYWATEHN